MASAPKSVFTVQVRQLVDFALRRGDLGAERDFVTSDRALAGTRGHQRIQRSRPPGYQKEVPVRCEVETDELTLRIQGRIDGLLIRPGEVLLEEIKTVQGGWDGLANPLHWAQAKIYGYLYAQTQPVDKMVIQLSYLDLETNRLTEFHEAFSLAELQECFAEATTIYLEWIGERHRWCQQRDQSIHALEFPFPRYRPGQRELAVAAYRVLARGGRLFLEAPTGIGKTISVLFPAVKAMAEGELERIFYLTARTVGRVVAEKALTDLRQAGLKLRMVTLTAKERICLQEGQPCEARTCPLARGYYDRCKAAMRAALERGEITRPVLESVSREHQVCPFELSLDLSLWVDAVICDYNYVFDPRVYLRRHFAEEGGDCGFLVDEAHNLVDRAREMFSADLDSRELSEIKRSLKEALPRCARSLTKLVSALRKLGHAPAHATEPGIKPEPGDELDLFTATAPASPPDETTASVPSREPGSAGLRPASSAGVSPVGGSGGGTPPEPAAEDGCATRAQGWDARGEVLTRRELPADLLPLIEAVLREAETWLARNEPAPFRENLLEVYFHLRSFQRTAELYDERFVTILQPGAAARVRLFCLDPSFLLRQALERGKAAVFFSATLTPLDYYRHLLGGSAEDTALQLPSPFEPEELAVLVHDRIRTQLKARAETLTEVAQAIGALVLAQRGNYLVYLPSYQYLTAVQQQFQVLYPAVSMRVQRPGMTEAEREAFLAAFAEEHGATLVGFAVLGGIFGEGIDLVGDRLIGAAIVGVGLPQLGVERDLIRDYFQERTGAGFEYAYTFPGMNRVLQASGRVIRSETDQGVVLLIDTRFAELRYRRLFPGWWRPVRVRSLRDIKEALRGFWAPVE
jgi:DNA excision repair protein ERCC-2